MGSTGLEFINAWTDEGLARCKAGERISQILDEQSRAESMRRVIDKVYAEHAKRCTFSAGAREHLYALACSLPDGTSPWDWAQILGRELEAYETSCSEGKRTPMTELRLMRELADGR